MSDIRKRVGERGITYQVRYQTGATKSGVAYKTFATRKEARAFLEGGGARVSLHGTSDIKTVGQATDLWLQICEKEGLNGREPVTSYTHENYEYRAGFIKLYDWPKGLSELTAPDIVAFRSWLLNGQISRVLAGKVLSSLQSILREMTVRGHLSHNPAAGISVREDARYREPVVIPSKRDVLALLSAADALANMKNETIANAWKRYRPMLYLAADSGMRPQEYLAVSKSSLREDGVQVDRAIEGCGSSITVTKTPAGRRFIELSEQTLDLVRHYAEHEAVANDYDLIFPAENGQWQSRRNWQRRGFNVACEKAGLMEKIVDNDETIERPKYRPYDLRHFFASMLIEKKVNLKKIQTLMGHTNIETTLNVYGHLLEDAESRQERHPGLLDEILQKSCGESVAIAT